MQIKYIKEGYFKSYDKLTKPTSLEDKMENIANRNQKVMINMANDAFKSLTDAAANPSARSLYYRKAGKALDEYIYIRATTATAPTITKIQCVDIEHDDANTIHVVITVAHSGSLQFSGKRSSAMVYTVNCKNLYDGQSKEQILADLAPNIARHLYSFATSAFPGRPLVEAQKILQHPIVIDDIIMCGGDATPVTIVFDDSLLKTRNITPDDPNFSNIIESTFDLITDTFTFRCGKDKLNMYMYYWCDDKYGLVKRPYRVIK